MGTLIRNRIHTVEEVQEQKLRRTSLAPIAYSEVVMPSMYLARSSRIAHRIAKILLFSLLCTCILMLFAPWQQSVTGSGSVIPYDPSKRSQTIEATIEGQIVRWNDSLVENMRVSKDDFIAEIRDVDKDYTERLTQQLRNTEQTWASTKTQIESLKGALAAQTRMIEAYEMQVKSYKRARQDIETAQDAYVQMATRKVEGAREELIVYESAIPQLEPAVQRAKNLYEQGNLALEKLQTEERKLAEGRAKVRKASFDVQAAESELAGKKSDREAYLQKADAEVQYYTAMLDKAHAEVSKAESDLAKATQESNKAEKEVLEMQVKLARQKTQEIRAPFDGFLVQVAANAGSLIVKKGDPICTIVPDTKDRAVQIWLNGNDAPLVEPGRHVRLQFEGWPAIQFAGWPSVAVGTFGGTVVSVDAIDDGKGKFRIQVLPDKTDAAWPEERFLRQGVRTNGWVLLDEVPLWFEVWRNLNGFPPTVDVNYGSGGKGGKGDEKKSTEMK